MNEFLILSASPRSDGNCDDAVRLLRESCGSATCVALRDYNIKRCHGCLNCQQGNPCEINDDFAAVWKRVQDASNVVLIVPIYWCSPPGLFKDFMDRTVVSMAGQPLNKKTFHLVSVAQSAGFDPHEKIIETWIRWLGGTALKSKTRLIAFHKGELLQNASAIRKLKKLGTALC